MYFQTLSNYDILKVLKSLNEEMKRRGTYSTIIITGGSALSLLTSGARVTQDIDYIGKLPFSPKELDKYYLSNDVERILIVPDISEMTFGLNYTFSNLDVKVLSWEDLAIMKFYSTRVKDLNDLREFILPNIFSFEGLWLRLNYYKSDYIFSLDDLDLNLNSWNSLIQDIKKDKKIVVCNPNKTLEEVLKSVRCYSKFMNANIPFLNKSIALKTDIRSCLSVGGICEVLARITGYNFRI